MKWSLRIGRFSGIDVRMHITFLLLVGLVALMYWRQGQSLAAAMAGVGFILSIFLCVVLHEFGHALAARRYGIKTRDIVLLPIGGVARLEKLPTNPLHELWVSLAGPAVNVAIAALLFAWLKLTASSELLQLVTGTTGPFIERIIAVNLFMVVFNMIPAFPMDGGRVLRAVLAMRTSHGRATQIAASFGQGIAVFFGVIGLFYNPFLLLIAVFVWFGASQEARSAQMQTAVDGIPVQKAMLTDFKILEKDDRLERAVEYTLESSQKDFPVVRDGRIEGILTQSDLMKALSEGNRYSTVQSAIQNKVEAVESNEDLKSAIEKFKTCNCQTLPVTLQSRLVGLLTMDKLSEYLRIRAAMAN